MGLHCAYIRLSEEDLNKSKDFSESIINQIELIEEYARKNDIHIDKKYIDEGYSGINFCRPAFESLLKEIEQNNIETIITKDFSRLGREYIETSFYITRFFPEHSIRYIAINEDYDSAKKNNDAKEMMVGIKGIINDRYIKETSRKIKAVKEQKYEKGYYMGFIAPYGYKKLRAEDGRITLKIDENVSRIVKLIFQEIIEGKSRKDIAESLNSLNVPSPMQYMEMTKSRGKNYYDKWTAGIIYRIIRNITYTGNTYKRKSTKEDYRQKKRDYIRMANRTIIPNTHPAIIDEITFEKANSMLRTNTKTSRLKDYKGTLDGLVRCGECGKVMNVSGRKKESGRIVYQFYCTDGKNKHKECSNTKAVFTNRLENIVSKTLTDAIKNINEEEIISKSSEYISNKRKMKNEIEMLKREIEIKKTNIKNLYLQKVSNQITIEFFTQKRKEINEQIEEREKRISQITEYIEKEIQHQEVREQYEKFKNENNLMKHVNNLVQTINIYKDGKIEIRLNFCE